jgi:hypothetical protein
MPNPLSILPDDELAIIQYLRTIAQVTALVPSASIRTELPPTPAGQQPAYPYVLITRGGGQSPDFRAMDLPAIQVDTLATDKHTAKALMLTVRAAILAIANDIVPEAVLASAYEEVGPSWLPDTIPVPPIPRYTARFRILLHK